MAESPESPPERFERELSWLNFNGRVLRLASEPSVPLLERVRFLSIVSSNLDEFFEIRVAGLLQQVESGAGPDNASLLREVLARAHAQVGEQYRIWREELRPALAAEGIHALDRGDLRKADLTELGQRFDREILPALTPLAIDPSHPFPVLTNKNLYILVRLAGEKAGAARHAVVPVPRILPRVVLLGKSGREVRFTFLSHVIKAFADRLFPGMRVQGAWAFRITRNSDLYVDEDEEGNLLEAIEEEIHRLRKGAPVRLEITGDAPEETVGWLCAALDLEPDCVFRIDGPVNLVRLGGALDLVQRPDLAYPAFQPTVPPGMGESDPILARLAKGDVLLHHPYESFAPVVDFLRQAARDPEVVSIKLTLYRTSGDSPVMQALKEAAEAGKQVTVLIELRARFDELNNIAWARQLEEAGAHVVYGLVGYKTHCKACLVVRREKGVLRRYAHLGTGNYNPRTAKVYTDLSLFTADPEVTEEVGLLFNVLTGNLAKPRFRQLVVAPFDLQRRMVELIDAEAAAARLGRPAAIFAKVNSLVDPGVIEALERASQAGVPIDLLVRGTCCLVPGVPGRSETIRVRSVLGRFLEHSRIFRFENAAGGEPLLLLGSADWMQRNFVRRVECVFPVRDPALRKRLDREILATYRERRGDATLLGPDGAHRPATPGGRADPCAQDAFLALAAKPASAGEREKLRARKG